MESEQLEDFVRRLPNLPGVYLMKDAKDNIIYIGKAISLKKRVGQYFRKSTQHTPKNKVLVDNIKSIEYIVTESDVEALILESNLIKQHRPRYNVRLRDDKGYPYIKVNIKSDYPRASLSRRRIRDGSLYFGPFTSSDSVRKTLKLLSRVFKIRPCAKRITGKEARPCLNYHINQCLAPCVSGEGGVGITKEVYKKTVDDAVAFLRGDIGRVTRIIEKRMAEYVHQREYEKAAQMRDDLAAISEIHKKQMITVVGKGDKDIIAMARSDSNDSNNLIAAIQVFFIREGALVGHADYQVDTGGNSDGSVISSFVSEYYQDFPIPSEIVSEIEMDDVPTIEAWMHAKTGRNIHIHKAGKDLDLKLVDMAKKNASMLLEQYHLRTERVEKSTSGALIELQGVLNLDGVPLVIECFDISHISGTDTVASLVVFENGMAKNSRYRHFKIQNAPKGDDYAAMHEVVGRRFKRLVEENGRLPDLVVVDGGRGQLNAAIAARNEVGRDAGAGVSGIPIIALAKQFEHIFTPDLAEPIVLSRNSPALQLLQRLRDESHRFATRLHRKLRSSRLSESVLDGIEGVGPKRVALLLAHFGSVEAIRKADVEEIAGVGNIGRGLGEKIVEYLERNV